MPGLSLCHLREAAWGLWGLLPAVSPCPHVLLLLLPLPGATGSSGRSGSVEFLAKKRQKCPHLPFLPGCALTPGQ